MILKCKMCGGDIVPIEGKNIAECLYCKSLMTFPNPDNEKIVNLYNRANDFRLSNQFDKAYGVYETILEIDNKQVEAHWGLLLCKYGVEYIDDPATGLKVPTCHRTITTSILKDIEFKIIEENSSGEALELYKKEAQKIDEIQKGILELSSKEEPYDIFICYKETDSNGERTHDSVIAQDIYDKLTSNNYKVFFSRITLENKLGTEYEPYIYSALKSSKVMLVVGTTEENFNAVWVKNEWSRYLEMMEEDKTKSLIPVYSKIDAYKLPEEFAMLQAQSMDKIGAMQDLAHGVQKLIDESKRETTSDVEKFKQAMDEASNLGDGKYEVVVMKEKASTLYYGFILFLILGFVLKLSGFTDAGTLISIFNNEITISTLDFFRRISAFAIVPYLLSAGFAGIALIMPFFGRKHYRRSKYMILIAIVFEIILMASFGRCGYIDLNIVPLLIELVFWFVNPKWHIDSSLKLVMDKDRKDKTQENNDNIVKNFKEKDKKIVNKLYYIIIFVITIVLVFICIYYLFFPSDNGRNRMINQIKVTSTTAIIYAEETFNTPIAQVNYGEYYDIINEIKENRTYNVIIDDEDDVSTALISAYEIRTKKGVYGYISSSRAQKVFGKNDPLYGKVQSNDRDSSILQLRITTEFINIRNKPSVTSSIIGKVYEDEIYTVLGIKEEKNRIWYKIKTTFGVEGYISDRYFDDNNNTATFYIEMLEP